VCGLDCSQNRLQTIFFACFIVVVFLTYFLTHSYTRAFYGSVSGTTLFEPVPEEKFWTLWCKGRLTEADTPTIQMGASPSRLSTKQCPPPPFVANLVISTIAPCGSGAVSKWVSVYLSK